MPPRECSVCSHSSLDAIDRALVEGVPLRRLAATYSLSRSALLARLDQLLPRVELLLASRERVATLAGLLCLAKTGSASAA